MLKRKNIRVVFTIIMSCMILIACGRQTTSDITGTWIDEDGDEMSFYSDGTCVDVPEYEISPSNKPESYVVQEDGKLFFTLAYGDRVIFERAESRESALDDKDTYYISNDELIFKEKIYTKK